MTRKELDALRAKQVEVQKEFDTARGEAEEKGRAKEPIPKELKERATKARDKLVEIGEQIATGEADLARAEREDAEFLSGLTPKLEETTRTTPTAPNGSTGVEITRDTADLFHAEMRRRYGSDDRSNPYNYQVRSDSEQLTLDMLRCNDAVLPARQAEFAARGRRIVGEHMRHDNAVTGGGTAQGGIIVPDDNTFMREVQLAMLAFGGVANVSRIINTLNGRPLPIPTLDDTGAAGAGVVAENAAANDVNLQFGETALRAHMVTSGRLSATEQAIEDAGPTLPMLLGMLAGERIARVEAGRFVNGTGSGQHTGLVTSYAVTASDVLSYSRGAPGYTNFQAWQSFINFKYSVNPAYRAGDRFSFVIADQLDQEFARAVDMDGRPLFREWGLGNTAKGMGMRYGGMNILADYSIPAVSFAANSANNPFGWIGDFNKFWIRRVAGMVMRRDQSTNAANFATNWVFGRRSDSIGLFNTGANPAVKQVKVTIVN